MVPYIQIQTKANTFVLLQCCRFFFRLLFKLGYQAEYPYPKWGSIIALQRSVRSGWDRNLFFLYKNQSLVLIYLMTCKAIGSPDRFSSSTQPRYEIVWYCLICTVPYLMLRLLSFLNRFFVPNNMHLVLSSPKWLLSLLSTNQSKKFCWVLCQLLWHLCVGTLNQSRLRKGTIHSLQPGTCHLHIVRTINALR